MTALILWLAGMPLAAVCASRMLQRLPDDDWEEWDTAAGYVALALIVLFWPAVAVGLILHRTVGGPNDTR